MSEAKITKKTKALLDKYESQSLPIYYNKISDRFTSGIPDIQGTFYGVSFYIELKDEGKEARKLQDWHLKRAKKAQRCRLLRTFLWEMSGLESIFLGCSGWARSMILR